MARDTRRLAIAVCVFFTLLACSNSAENLPSVSNDPIIVNPTPEPVTIMPTPKLPPTASPTKSEIAHAEIATMRVISTRPHDETAFTQGLEFYGDRLFESRGLRGSSGLAEINASDGEVLRDISLAPQLFGEGITIVGDTIIQLTWTSGKHSSTTSKHSLWSINLNMKVKGGGCALTALRSICQMEAIF